MATIALTGGFTIIPEGTHVFKITDVSYKEEYGKIEVKMKTANGQTHIERFTIMRKDGSTNDGAMNAFSHFARTALQNPSITEIDHKDIIGRFIRCTIEHDVQPHRTEPGKTVTFTHITEKYPADGYEEAGAIAPKSEEKTTTGGFDIGSLLG